MALFYLVAGAVALLTALALARPLLRGGGGAASREAADAALYRDQLAEIERDLARGAITAAEAEGARA
ncbi:MAG TPA: c-type cytochrome biogenesis protein CcmI, partial [Thermohalobaculum sp.]|nr:c-type cytochrome biogenesis protein CcmI [Thermohalobaculum sp.]